VFIANIEDPEVRSPAVLTKTPAGGPGPGGFGGGRGGHTGPAYWIKVSARADGSFTVTNPRNNFSKTYRGN
jgi:hypothetical protein